MMERKVFENTKVRLQLINEEPVDGFKLIDISTDDNHTTDDGDNAPKLPKEEVRRSCCCCCWGRRGRR
jgi:hypothetical protein